MKHLLASLATMVVLGAVLLFWQGLRSDSSSTGASPLTDRSAGDPIARGRYLVQVGDCRACHTTPAGGDYAGGRAIPTPFGTFYSPNITPDAATGIGAWTAQDFWKALHEGKGRDGGLLYPSFPYTNYTKLTRDDSDAMFAYLRTLPAVHQPRRPHALRFPYNYRLLLVGWRALFFRPGSYQAAPDRNAEWNRGAYLVQGLGHCSACHEARNALGAVQSKDNPAGGLVLNWYAPALTAGAEAGVQHWQTQEIASLLKHGMSPQGSMLGPMAEVVYESLQHVADEDIQAMATYLKSLPGTAAPRVRGVIRVPQAELKGMLQRGAVIYEKHCAGCHGDSGEGRTPAAPALAGNRAVTMDSAVNPIRAVLFGGYPPGTAGNPRPFGMPPFGNTLRDQEVAEVLTYVRSAWGNQARPIAAQEVRRNNQGPLW